MIHGHKSNFFNTCRTGPIPVQKQQWKIIITSLSIALSLLVFVPVVFGQISWTYHWGATSLIGGLAILEGEIRTNITQGSYCVSIDYDCVAGSCIGNTIDITLLNTTNDQYMNVQIEAGEQTVFVCFQTYPGITSFRLSSWGNTLHIQSVDIDDASLYQLVTPTSTSIVTGAVLVTPVPVRVTNPQTTTEDILVGIREYAHASYVWMIGTSVVIIGVLVLLFLRVRV